MLAFALLACPARTASAQELEPLPPPAPAPAAPLLPPPLPPSSEVRFEPEETDVALYRLSTAAGVERFAPLGSPAYAAWYALYDPVCPGPCTTRLTPGAYRFALAKGGHIVPLRGPVVLAGPATLRAEYVDRSTLRAAGLIIGVAGAIGGFAMVVASADTGAVCDFSGFCVSTGSTDVPLLVTGVSVLVGAAVVGSILTLQGDSARMSVEPLNLSGHVPREAALTAWRSPQGASVALHF
jgi:hypothetical protein